MTWTEKILDLSVVTDKKLIAAEGAAHFWWDKDIYYIDSNIDNIIQMTKFTMIKLSSSLFVLVLSVI
jgi:hypothetical protein